MAYKIFVLYLCAIILQGYESKTVQKARSKYKLVIDHDGGADDAMAVSMSVLYEKYFYGPEVVALTTTHGNVNETQAFINSQRFLDLTGRRDIPIYRGATRSVLHSVETDYYFGYDGLGDNKDLASFEEIQAERIHAAVGLIELSKKYEGELIVMAIGPLTNIALAQRLDPDFIGRLAQLYLGAGNIYSDIFNEPEFNALLDVEAYYIVTEAANVNKVTLVPFSQIKTSLNTTREWRENVMGAIPTETMKMLNKFEQISLTTSERWTLLDPAVAALVLDSHVVKEFRYADNSIHVCGNERALNINKMDSVNNNLRLVYSIHNEYYKKLLIDIFSAELNVC